MMMSLRTTRVIAAALAVPALFAGAACAQDASAETVTSVMDTGASGDVVTLPPAATVGQTSSGTISLDMVIDVSVSGQDVSVDAQFGGDVTNEVVEVTEDGGYVVRSTFSDVEVDSSNVELAGQLQSVFPDVLTYEETYDESGRRVSSEVIDTGLTPDELETAEEFVSQSETGSLYPPGVPVGVGASWTATTVLESSAADIDLTVVSELSSLTENEYVVDMTIDSDIDTEIEGERMTGSIGGGGQLTGNRANPLVAVGSMVIEMELSGGDMSMTMDITVDYDFTDQPA